LDRNAILDGYVSSFADYSRIDIDESTEIFDTSTKMFDDYGISSIEKVLKFSGNNLDLLKRSDIKSEVVVFRLLGGTTNYMLDDDKPDELLQNFEAIVFIQQANVHSIKDKIYDRMLEITDQLINWGTQVSADTVNEKLYTISLTGVGAIEERDGYIATSVTFQSIIQIS